MSHLFGVDSIREKIIILSSLSISGESFICRYAMGSSEYHKTYSTDDYLRATKYIASNYMIEISVKIRNIIDCLIDSESNLKSFKTIEAYNSGPFANGKSNKKDFRFICNKIIHADSFNLNFEGSAKYHADMVWWSGEVTVSGVYQGEPWELFFSVSDWCDAIVDFLNESEHKITVLQGTSRDLQQNS